MENIERTKKPDIKTEELLDLLEKIPWENNYNFSFNGTNFNLLIITQEEIDRGKAGESAEFFRSTLINGFDIYMHDNIPQADRKRMLFHEILECNLLDQKFTQEAHQITLEEEEKVFGKREA